MDKYYWIVKKGTRIEIVHLWQLRPSDRIKFKITKHEWWDFEWWVRNNYQIGIVNSSYEECREYYQKFIDSDFYKENSLYYE